VFDDQRDHQEFEDPKPRYRLCKIGFTLGAIALGLQCASITINVVALFGGVDELRQLIANPTWDLLIGTPITWSALIGSVLLVGRWDEPRWKRRAGLLLMMNAVDLAFWTSDNARYLGFAIPELQNPWFRHVGGVLQWFELMLFAGLAGDVLAHLGKERTTEAVVAARSFALVGLTLWAVQLLSFTDWRAGWPPQFLPLRADSLLLALGSMVILALTAFQGTLLNARAGRECSALLRQLAQTEQSHELLESRSEPFDDRSALNGPRK
jgi:hypothetical protein